MVREPDDPVGDEPRTGGERVVWKHLQQVRDPADGAVPSRRGRQRCAVVWRSNEDGATEREPARDVAERTRALNEIPEHETAARMRDDVEGCRVLGKPLEQHPRVLLGRPAEREMV